MTQRENHQPTRPSAETRAAEREDAHRAGGPDRPPTPEEEARADDLDTDPEVAEHYKEMSELGAEAKGEGRIP